MTARLCFSERFRICTKPSSNGQQRLIVGRRGQSTGRICMYNTTICVIVVIMLTSTVAGARPHNNHTNGQAREQYCRQLVGPEKGKARPENPPPCDRKSCDGMIA